MKLQAREVEAFVRKPRPDIRAVLLFGSDAGMIRERARAIARSAVEDLNDPFRVSSLTVAQLQDDPARLADEVGAMALTGGRRVVMVSGAGDRNAKLFEGLLDAVLVPRERHQPPVLVVEAGHRHLVLGAEGGQDL